MRIRLSDAALVPELRQHFELSGFVTNRFDEDTIEAWRPDAPSEQQNRREVELHLIVWRTMHPETIAEAVD
jgi:hypothetical protein